MGNWHDLPLELKLEVLQDVQIPAIDDGTFITYMRSVRCIDCLEQRQLRLLIWQHARRQTRTIENLVLFRREFALAPVPALRAHIEDITRHVDELDGQRDDLEGSYEEDDGYRNESFDDCFKLWRHYLQARERYARRLLMRFEEPRTLQWRNLPVHIRQKIMSFALPKIDDTVIEQALRDRIGGFDVSVLNHLRGVRQAFVRLLAVNADFANRAQNVAWSMRHDFEDLIMEHAIRNAFAPALGETHKQAQMDAVDARARARRTSLKSFGVLDYLLDWYNVFYDVYGFTEDIWYEDAKEDILELPRYYWEVHPDWMGQRQTIDEYGHLHDLPRRLFTLR